MPEITHADRARLAHRALRLRESGVDSERALRDLDSGPGENNDIGSVGYGGLGLIAARTVDFLDRDRPGPTDPELVERLMSAGLTSIWEEWNDAVTANLEEKLDDRALQQWRESVVRDEHAAREAWEAAGFDPGDVHPYFGHGRHGSGAANALYDFGRQGFLDATIDWDTATIKVCLVDSADYTVNLATHQFFSSVTSAGRVATSGGLANKTVTAGVADADDITFASVTGDPSEALVIFQSSAVGGGADVADTSQRLIGYIDTATGLPVTPNGGNINVAWDSGSNRIFKL
jgi:hypothetical protein